MPLAVRARWSRCDERAATRRPPERGRGLERRERHDGERRHAGRRPASPGSLRCVPRPAGTSRSGRAGGAAGGPTRATVRARRELAPPAHPAPAPIAISTIASTAFLCLMFKIPKNLFPLFRHSFMSRPATKSTRIAAPALALGIRRPRRDRLRPGAAQRGMRAERRTPVVVAVEKIGPSVVNISAEQLVRGAAPRLRGLLRLDPVPRDAARSRSARVSSSTRGHRRHERPRVSGASRICVTTVRRARARGEAPRRRRRQRPRRPEGEREGTGAGDARDERRPHDRRDGHRGR